MSSRSEEKAASLWRRAIRRAWPRRQGLAPQLPGFDWRRYVESYPDLAAAGIADEASALRHWREYGRAEGRRVEPAPPEKTYQAPPGFDWQWYVRAYTDLAPVGINDEGSAIRHWREHGQREGRRIAPRRPSGFDWLTYVDRYPEPGSPEPQPSPALPARLVCPSVDSIFLRAWGDLVCWDDAGSDRVLQAWDPAADYADVFLNGLYQQVRTSVDAGRMAWPEDCERCLLLRVLPSGPWPEWDRRTIRILRVEPSYYCSLDCPGCVPLAVRRQHSKEFQLDPEILDRILADLVGAGLSVELLDFQGHGEPLLNPRLWEMARRSRGRLSETWISMCTNANGIFHPDMARSGFDEVICAIDGIDQESYEKYRVHGHFDMAFRFLRDLAGASGPGGRRLRVVWKYVLFEHNSSPEMLLEAQRMAREVGVSELVFVLTRNGPAPRHIQFPADVPRLNPGPPISFRFHQPSVEDLEARLDEARRLSESGRSGEAVTLKESVRRNLERFFPTEREMPERQRRLFEETGRLKLP